MEAQSPTTPAKPSRFRLSLSTSTIIGLVVGVLCGVVLGDYCAHLKFIGDAFIKLLQMTILPYIVVSLVHGIGRLTYERARVLAIKAGLLMLLFWAVGFAVMLVMPLAFPDWESASFFSTTAVEAKRQINYLDLYIPSNPFGALANNVVPAVVIFSIAIGIALIGIKDKYTLIDNLSLLSSAFTRVAYAMVKLTPLGVFAISATAAGTMTVDEFGRLQIYFATYISAAILLTFWILPAMVATCTPFKYREIVGLSRDALVVAFTTANLFVVLPILANKGKHLFDKRGLLNTDTDSFVDVVLPIAFSFPTIGKLLLMLFIPFAGWFAGSPLMVQDYISLVFSGLFSFFGSVTIAVPFLLDSFRLPADLFGLFVLTGILNGRFAAALAAMNLFVFILMAACAATGSLSVKWTHLVRYGLITAALTVGTVAGARIVLSRAVQDPYDKDKVIAAMHLLHDPVETVVHKAIPADSPMTDPAATGLKAIRRRGVLRVGYNPDRLPYSFFNQNGDLVGLDVDMAHRLAKDLAIKLEFVPVGYGTMIDQLDKGQFDLIMSGVGVTSHRLETMRFSEPYLEETLALVVKDHRRHEFATRASIKRMGDLRIGFIGESYFQERLQRALPQAQIVVLQSVRDYFEGKERNLDALLATAESGSAWCLLYPQYQPVIPQPKVITVPLAYPVAGKDRELADFLSYWIELRKRDGTIDKLYNYWILGRDVKVKERRWSVIRNVLHWVD